MCKISIYYPDVLGLRTKCQDLYRTISNNNYDKIILTETWLCDSIQYSELCDNNVYHVFTSDRNCSAIKKKIGGGTLILVKHSFNAYARHEWCNSAGMGNHPKFLT